MNILSRMQKQLLPHISRIFSALPNLSQFRFTILASFFAFVALNVWMSRVTPNELIIERMDLLSSPFSSTNHILLGKQFYALGNMSDATKELYLARQVSTFSPPFSFFVPSVLGAQSEPTDVLSAWEQDRSYTHRAYSFWKTVVEKNPDYRDAYITLAKICLRLDKRDAAITYVKTAYLLDPNDEIIQEFAAQLGVLL
ncbi:MAG: tetratricopeptide repeat protein [Microgenomates group bacterium]